MKSLILAGTALALIAWRLWVHVKKFAASRKSRRFWQPDGEAIAPETGEEELSSPHQEASVSVDYSELSRAFRIADMRFARGEFEDAEQWFIKVLAMDSQHAETLNRLGVIYIQQGNPRRAEIIYRKLLSITQKEPSYYANYGRCLYAQKRLEEAIEAYENAIKLEATEPARFASLGQIHYERKDYAKMLECFVRALELAPKNADFLSLTAEAAELAGDSERQRACLKKMAEMNPYNEELKVRLNRLEAANAHRVDSVPLESAAARKSRKPIQKDSLQPPLRFAEKE